MDFTVVLQILLGTGVLEFIRYLISTIREVRSSKTPAAQSDSTLTLAEKSLLVVSKSRDELEADNARLVRDLAREHTLRIEAEDRAAKREADLLRRIDELEERLSALLTEVRALRYDAHRTLPHHPD